MVGQAHQKLERANPQTYLGPGKLAELVQLAKTAMAETIIFVRPLLLMHHTHFHLFAVVRPETVALQITRACTASVRLPLFRCSCSQLVECAAGRRAVAQAAARAGEDAGVEPTSCIESVYKLQLQLLVRPGTAALPATVQPPARAAALTAGCALQDDELSPRQLRALEKALGQDVRVCDRTMLILDIFSQRAASREGQLQARLLLSGPVLR